MTFGAFLQAHRQSRGWTQQELAERLGISRQSVIGLEKGQHWPSLDLAMEMAKLFDLSLDVLARAVKEPAAIPIVPFPGSEQLKGIQPVVWSTIGTTRVVVPTALLEGPSSYPDALWDQDTKTLTPLPGARPDDRVLLAGGCDPFLPWLAEAFHEKHPGWHLQPVRLSSERALELFNAQFLHMAGTHLYDAASRQYNPEGMVSQPHVRIAYLRWEEGLMRQPDQQALHLAIREPGSEAHALYLRERRRTSYPPEIFYSHHTVTEMVRYRNGWAGVGLGALAVPQGLLFEPWSEEHYDLWVSRELLGAAWGTALLSTLSSRTLASRIATLPHVDLLTSP